MFAKGSVAWINTDLVKMEEHAWIHPLDAYVVPDSLVLSVSTWIPVIDHHV